MKENYGLYMNWLACLLNLGSFFYMLRTKKVYERELKELIKLRDRMLASGDKNES